MRRFTILSAFTLAVSTLAPLLAQTSVPPGSPFQTASLLPYSPAWATYAVAEHAGPAYSSSSDAGPIAIEFAAILSVPCSDRILPPGPQSPDADRRDLCPDTPNLNQRFLNTPAPAPLSSLQKAQLAIHNLKDPGNLATVADIAAFTVATNSHTAYGPGLGGFARAAGYSYLQEATGEFFGTFLIPSLAHQDPRYHRMPNAAIPRRIAHALTHTFVAPSDTGAPMPNYSALLTYPISAEIGNLYVPGIHGNGPSTARRILAGYATDPIENLVAEFLPDVARRIHVRVIFVQRVLNQVSSDQYTLP
ncbi:MAG TPA: hypothetical protein VGN01_04675 [Acidobacteriaceae bacterium]|jgi:hypothetical protein